jgi:hypothetical protein
MAYTSGVRVEIKGLAGVQTMLSRLDDPSCKKVRSVPAAAS